MVDLLKAAAKEFGQDKAGRMAAALTYYTIFALVPLLFLAAAIAGFVFEDQAVLDDAVARVSDVAGDEIGETIAQLLEAVRDQRGSALGIGLVLAAFSASGLFQQVQGVLNRVFAVPDQARRKGPMGWLINRSIALVSALILTIMVVIPVGAVGAANWLIDLLPTDSGLVQVVANVALLIISFLLLTVIIGFTFQTLTNIVIPWKAARRGGLATAVVGLVAAYGVGQYLARAAGSGTLGALGGIAVLLFFFNLMWNVYLFGGEVTKVYGDRLKAAEAQAEREVAEEQAALSVAGPAPKISRSGKISREALSGKVEAGAGAFLVGLALGWFGRRR